MKMLFPELLRHACADGLPFHRRYFFIDSSVRDNFHFTVGKIDINEHARVFFSIPDFVEAE